MEDRWIEEQLELRNRCNLNDEPSLGQHINDGTLLVGGLDISYPSNMDASYAFAGLAVFGLKYVGLNVHVNFVNEICQYVKIAAPYINGFLAFREVPSYMKIISKYLEISPSSNHPHVYMLDGNGTMHPRAFGSACHLGVLMDKPVFGVAKNLIYIPQAPEEPYLTRRDMRKKFDNMPYGGSFEIKNADGWTCGMAVQTGKAKNPVFISPGHKITLATSVKIAKAFAIHRIPEPIRRADNITRNALKHFVGDPIRELDEGVDD